VVLLRVIRPMLSRTSSTVRTTTDIDDAARSLGERAA